MLCQLSIVTIVISALMLQLTPSPRLQLAGVRDQAVPQTRDMHFLAGIRKALLPYWEPLPIFPAAPGKAVGTADFRELVCCCNTKWKC